MQLPNPAEGLSPEEASAMQFFSNLSVAYGDKLDKVAREPFFLFANQHLATIGTALRGKKNSPPAKEDE